MKKAIKTGLVVAAMGFLSGCFLRGSAGESADIPALIQAGALVVDVRTPGEFSAGHVEGAVNIPYDFITREIDRHAVGQDQPIILYCRSGARASVAQKSLFKIGYTNVVNAATLRNMQKILAQ